MVDVRMLETTGLVVAWGAVVVEATWVDALSQPTRVVILSLLITVTVLLGLRVLQWNVERIFDAGRAYERGRRRKRRVADDRGRVAQLSDWRS